MTVRIKQGGAWYAVPNGNLRVRDGGAWKVANFCYIKINGAWYDSGYRGYPNAPQNMRVASWDFGTVVMTWDGPAAGGAPVDHYEWQKLDANGNFVSGPSMTNATQAMWGVSEDERCQFRMRSISAGGLASAWSNTVRVQIGHSEQSHVVTDTKTRQWGSGMDVNAYGPDNTYLIYVPSSVNVSSWYLNLSATFSTSVLSPTATREINHVFANVIQGTKLNWANPTQGWFSYVYNGQNSYWGFYVHGTGWSTGPTGGYRMVGRFEIWGDETYYENRTVIDRDYAGNSYW